MPEVKEPEILNFKLATPDVREVVKTVAAKFHKDVDVEKLLVLMACKELKSKGRRVGACIKVASAQINAAYAFGSGLAPEANGMLRVLDYVMIIDDEIWGELEMEHKEALVDHELCHVYYDDNDKPKTVGHDCEEFIDIVRRYGAWTVDLQNIIKVVEDKKSMGIPVPGLDENG